MLAFGVELEDHSVAGDRVASLRSPGYGADELDERLFAAIDGRIRGEARQASHLLSGSRPADRSLQTGLTGFRVVFTRASLQTECSAAQQNLFRREKRPARRIELHPGCLAESPAIVRPTDISREASLLRPLIVFGFVGSYGDGSALLGIESQRDVLQQIDVGNEACRRPERYRPLRLDA